MQGWRHSGQREAHGGDWLNQGAQNATSLRFRCNGIGSLPGQPCLSYLAAARFGGTPAEGPRCLAGRAGSQTGRQPSGREALQGTPEDTLNSMSNAGRVQCEAPCS